MQDEFLNRYQQYSNVDLLKIIQRPNDYQKEALNTAAQIISTRIITDEEQREVELFYKSIESREREKKIKIESYFRIISDLFEPIFKPQSSINPRKWLNLFLLLVGIQYAWTLVITIKHFIEFFLCDGCESDITTLGSFLTVFYVPLVFYLLYKRKKWGWILLFTDNLFSGLILISRSYILIKYPGNTEDPTEFIFSLVIKVVFLLFLWRDDIASFLSVTIEQKRKFAFRIGIAAFAILGSIVGLVFVL